LSKVHTRINGASGARLLKYQAGKGSKQESPQKLELKISSGFCGSSNSTRSNECSRNNRPKQDIEYSAFKFGEKASLAHFYK
jgi:hypothetical protein